MEDVIIIGAGGHAKVIADILLENGEYNIIGLIDSDKNKSFMDLFVIGDDSCLEALFIRGIKKAFIALGSNSLRKKLSDNLKNIGYEFINVISKHAVISTNATIGDGIAIMPGAIINAFAKIEDGCIINTNSSVDHDVIIRQYTHIAPGSAVAGGVTIGENSFLGTGCRVIDQIKIGNNVIIGAGAVVINNIEDNHLAVGIPAKIKK